MKSLLDLFKQFTPDEHFDAIHDELKRMIHTLTDQNDIESIPLVIDIRNELVKLQQSLSGK